MKFNTTRFGEIDIDEGKIITFPLGIPGFTELKRYVLLDYKEPIRWLHAVDDPDVAFIVTDPFTLFPDYNLKLDDEEENFLGIKDPAYVVVLVILTASESNLTANLKAPIVFNASNLKAAQILIDDERYSFKAPLPVMPKESSK
ncbi:MAG: flagellar assembly protein FliW [Nitrospirae bacterium]|nr:flagellar assembly protein FliW [Nitrospirota bacterium]MCL5237216.1 flagellar assembly protein FliW [Nitrospirota bacterium]